MSVPRGTLPPVPATNPLWAARPGAAKALAPVGPGTPTTSAVEPRADGSPVPAGARCARCAWHYLGGRGKPVDRCRRFANEPVDPRWPACPAFLEDAELDCLTCGACCREAYHSVEVGPRDPFVRAHPDRVSSQHDRLVVTRAGPRCGCLAGGPGDWRCVVYADRPKTCRDFERGASNCVDARRRVGLSR